jgi:hypothetical protein
MSLFRLCLRRRGGTADRPPPRDRHVRPQVEWLERRTLLSIHVPGPFLDSVTPFAAVAADLTGDGIPDVITVNKLKNDTAVEGSAAFTLTVTGSNFANDAVVQWDGTALATTYVNNTSLRVLIPTALLEEGTASITVADQAGTSTAVPFTVTDAPLFNLGVNPPRATEGIGLGPFTVAKFHDRNAAAPASDFTATISWGDGSSSTVAVGAGLVSLGGGVFAVRAGHTYAEEGTFTLSVQVLDEGGSSIAASRTIAVADAALSGLTITGLQPTESKGTGSVRVVTFHDSNPSAPASDFTATITWGDGSTTTLSGAAGNIVALGGGNFALVAGHTYAEQGRFTLSVQVRDDGGARVSGSAKVSVADAPLSQLSISNPGATEDQGTGTFTVATFSDANTGAPASDFTATVFWGDGSTSTVTGSGVVALGGGNFAVRASHTYTQEGGFTFDVEVLDAGHPEVSGRLRTTVADAPLSNLSIQPPAATEGQNTGTFTVATFTDAYADAARADFRARIAWGDGYYSEVNGVYFVSLGGGSFAVLASHTYYEEEGTYTLSVQVFDHGGAGIAGTQTLSIAEAPLSGLSIASPKVTEGAGTGRYGVATPTAAVVASLLTSTSTSALSEQLLTTSPPPSSPPSLLLSTVLSLPANVPASSGGGSGSVPAHWVEGVDVRASELLSSLFTNREPKLDLPTEQDVLSGINVAGALLTGTRPRANLAVGQRNTAGPSAILLATDHEEAAGPGGEAGAEEGSDVPLLMNPFQGTLLAPPPAPRALPPLLSRGPAPPPTAAVADAVFTPAEGEAPQQTMRRGAGPPGRPQRVDRALVLAAAIGLLSSTFARGKNRQALAGVPRAAGQAGGGTEEAL